MLMGRTSNSDKCRKWHERITEANKVFEEWDSRFKCDKLEDYYLGTGHWPASEKENDRYTINLVYATIEADKPSLLFYRPGVVVTPRPERADDPMTDINPRAQLQQDVLQTFVSDRRTGFVEQTNLALHESYFRFGVVEVGYTADYIDNPNAGRPLLKENSEEPMVDSSGGHVLEPDRVVSSENLFYRWIPAGRFRVGGNRNTLEWNDW
ncbi:MAG: hypothetical protein KKE65_02335, partial [Actinobacteria bacterium]|nr:hypothetical protein [Actinomycetota bacterium]